MTRREQMEQKYLEMAKRYEAEGDTVKAAKAREAAKRCTQ